ncbi:transcription termination factor NusA [Candidatus Comchoanobacter bicostacola]|uniref:Transcription termination/antitermination protein NusA n=1 Tax=Candidatus Comchoanobacter bicostacola TaxID=2919598 RepID=A0ABY5DK15_9GAMM|nr:transcription termination factor NusA [Candidatus Comchoanobacter bicostacola]UTC24826.1 transcription termination factor NusA [Candidatus Comchoanobacter bicostacola]
MTQSIITYIQAVAAEKGLNPEDVFSALELALATSTKKTFSEDITISCEINRKTGESTYYRVWTVVSDDYEDFNPDQEIRISDTKKDYDNLSIGDDIIEELNLDLSSDDGGASSSVGRIEIEKAKQVMLKAVRDAERAHIAREYESAIGDLFIGEVTHVSRASITLETTGIQAEIPRSELIPKEIIRKGDRIQGCLTHINVEGRGPLLQLSRKNNSMLATLFKQEVPEISEGIIQIKAAARDPGSRAKIAVKSNDARIDPIGACIGVKGSRVQAISNELHGERIDIIKWDNDPALLAVNALSPAEVRSIDINDEERTMNIAISTEMLSQAIGKSGQNINLASELVGWKLKIISNEQANELSKKMIDTAINIFTNKIDVDESVATALANENIKTISELADTDIETIAAIDGFDTEIAEELINRAKDYLLDLALSGNDEIDALMELDGMTMTVAEQLISTNISNRDALADMSVDELTESIRIDADQAAKIILSARAHWFEQDTDKPQ